MKVSGSTIAVYYAGDAQALDGPASQQSRAVFQHSLKRFIQPGPPLEQVLEGELLNERRRQERRESEQNGKEFVGQRVPEPPPSINLFSGNRAVRDYKSTAQLDGFSKQWSLNQLDVYV